MAKPIPSTLTLAVVITTWCLAVDPKPTRGAVVSEKWSVEYMLSAPDCLERVVMGINGMYPGPTLRARAGDTIQVEVTNKLPTEGLVIHWHGIRMIGTPWADGTASISQCPILPGESFNYTFKVDKPGTYFYHGHYGMQRASGLYGSLTVDVAQGQTEPFKYDDEFTLLLADWYHRSTHEQEVDLSTKPFRWIGEPQSLLMNGKGQFNCSLASQYNSSWGPPCKLNGTEHCAPQILHVSPNKVYRIRLASSTSLASLNFAVQGHRLRVVEADGNYVQPFEVDDLDIYSGDSYSVLLTADQPASANYWVRIGVRGRKPLTPPGLTILNYQPTAATALPAGAPPETPLWNNHTHSKAFVNRIFAAAGSPPPPSAATKRMVFLNTQNKIDGHFKWAINNVSLSLPPTPYLGSILFKLKEAFDQAPPPENYPAAYDITVPPANENAITGNGPYIFELNSTVDIVLQNANALNANTSEIHPWHLHGHDFWLLGYGDGKFTEKDAKSFNLKNPPLRNSAVVFPYGWTALRYVADNPGAWAFHCHIEPHLHMGMGVVVAEGVDQVKGIPADALACGFTRDLLDGKEFVP